tara:strand:- start:62 stop:472 length:411 start_codon:yes stop_codon:yes gene_type:complete
MCFGGGNKSTIIMPKTGAYDQQADLMVALMDQQMSGVANLKQAELNTAIGDQRLALTELRDLKIQQARDTQANASRMAALIGTPPPDKTAQAPIVGRDRKGSKQKPTGKRSLTVRANKKPSQGRGTGLNVSTSSYS